MSTYLFLEHTRFVLTVLNTLDIQGNKQILRYKQLNSTQNPAFCLVCKAKNRGDYNIHN